MTKPNSKISKVHEKLDICDCDIPEGSAVFNRYPYMSPLKDMVYVSMIEDKSVIDLCRESAESDNCLINYALAGDIKAEYHVSSPKALKALKKELLLHINRSCESFGMFFSDIKLTQEGNDYPDLWINYQKRTEYNPRHNHTGLLSFIIYIDIPECIREESEDNSVYRGLVQFSSSLTNEALFYRPKTYNIFIFESDHYHQVYPFYSDVTRISMSGNIHSFNQ
jgi:hypothetical protein